ncbi:MAG: hypothetical protein SF123_03220 [Chloroflexota bacterium]|nr:hypothetical protein [Chloroflexota bacterium]
MRVLALLLCCLVVAPVHAQITPPLIIMTNGGIYRYSEGAAALEPLSFCADGHALPPLVQSTDGARVAYRVAHGPWETSEQRYDPAHGHVTGIVICDLTQEAQGTLRANDGMLRTAPIWSPTGDSVAWVEWDDRQDTIPRLMRQDMATDTGVILVELPPQARWDALTPEWGEGGIALMNTRQDGAQSVDIYDPANGALIASHEIVPFDRTNGMGYYSAEVVSPFMWVDDNGVNKVLIREQDSRWMLFDPASNTVEQAYYPPEVYVLEQPDSAALVLYGTMSIEDTYEWRVRPTTDISSRALPFVTHAYTPRAVPPMSGDGAYVRFDEETYIYRPDGENSSIPLPEFDGVPVSMVWMPYAWRIWYGQSWVELWGLTGPADG